MVTTESPTAAPSNGTGVATGPVENDGPRLTVSALLLAVLVVTTIIGRLYCRLYLLRYRGSEDYCIVVATLAAIGLTITSCITVKYGLGQHIWNVSLENLVMMFKVAYISQIMYVLSLGFTKASLLLQLLRLSPSGRMRIVIWCGFIFTTAFTFGAFFASVFICYPPSYSWERIDPTKSNLKGHCKNYMALQYSILAILSDIIVWTLPFQLMWTIRLPRRQRIGLFGVFALGGLVPLAAVIRMVLGLRANVKEFNADPSFTPITLTIWSNIECAVAIICTSMPALRPLLKKIFPMLAAGGTARTPHLTTLSDAGNYGRNSRGKSLQLSSLNTLATRDKHTPRSSSQEHFVPHGCPSVMPEIEGNDGTLSSETG